MIAREVTGQGRTVLFVSHNMLAVRRLCSRAVWLDGGRVRATGPAAAVVGDYLRVATEALPERVWPDPATQPGTDAVRLAAVRAVSPGPSPSAPRSS